MPNADRIAAAHRRRLVAWGMRIDEDYTREVVERALTAPPPVLHAHAIEEMGMCVDCDAASALLDVAATQDGAGERKDTP